MTPEELAKNLEAAGISPHNEEEFNTLIERISDDTGKMTNVARYSKGHLFNIYGPSTELEKKIARCLGGLTDQDLQDAHNIAERMIRVSEYAHQRNCILYIDAEQTYIQNALDSYTQQMAFKLNLFYGIQAQSY